MLILPRARQLLLLVVCLLSGVALFAQTLEADTTESSRLSQLGREAYLQRNFLKADSCYQGAIDLLIQHAETTGDTNLWVLATSRYFEWGRCYLYAGSTKSGIQLMERSISISRNHLDTTHLRYILANMLACQIAYVGRDLQQAEYYAHRHLRLTLDNVGEKTARGGGAYNLLGAVYWDMGDVENARIHYEKALDIRLETLGHDSPRVGGTRGNLGLLYSEMGRYPAALEQLNMALRAYRETAGPRSSAVAVGLLNLGTVYLALQDYASARDTLLLAIGIEQQINHATSRNLGNLYHELGKAYHGLKNFDTSDSLFRAAIDVYSAEFGKYYPEIGNVYIDLGELSTNKNDLAGAVQGYQMALRTLAPEWDPANATIPNLATVPNEIQLLTALTAKARDLGKLSASSQAPKSISEEALLSSSQATQVVEAIRKGYRNPVSKELLTDASAAVFGTGVSNAYRLHELTQESQYLRRAFDFAERGKAALLREVLNESKAKSFAGVPDALLQRDEALTYAIGRTGELLKLQQDLGSNADSAKMVALRDTIFALHDKKNKLFDQLEKEYPQYFELKYQQAAVPLSAVSAWLPDAQTAVLEYFWTSDKLYRFTITKNGATLAEIENPAAIGDSLRLLVQDVSNRGLVMETARSQRAVKQFVARSTFLHEQLLPEELDRFSKLIIIPDGMLNYLPFELLVPVADAGRTSFSELSYLLRSHTIRYNYSAALLVHPSAEVQHDGEALAMAGFAPSYGNAAQSQPGRNALQPLLNNIPEVESICKLLSGNAFLGISATESQFKAEAGRYRILHLAMHALVNDSLPLHSNLVFSASGDSAADDGFLKVWEIYNLPLRAELTVLSACNTGLGKMVRGEGLMSLARAFRYAGCPNIVMSMWQAEDASTSEIMQLFYANLEDGMGKDEALREARLSYLDNSDNDHPYYWAAFVLIGDDAPITTDTPVWQTWWFWLLIAVGTVLGIAVRRRKA